MSQVLAPHRQSLRALLLGPTFSLEMVAGLQMALNDVATQLKDRGWQVDTHIWATPTDRGESEASSASWRSTFYHSNLAPLLRNPWVLDAWMSFIPSSIRRDLSMISSPLTYYEHVSHNLYSAERLIAEARVYDVVLFCVDGAPPGMSALLTARHERVAFVCLDSLGYELRASWRHWGPPVARWYLRKHMHPFLFRQILPAKVQLAIFASSQWQKEAIQAGLPVEKARTIYFGIPQPEPQPRSSESHHRILWIGRLSPEKGLHLLLRALPAIRKRVSDVTVTVIAGQGSGAYRQLIMQTIEKNKLENVIISPPMGRAALQAAYAAHDVLFFHSINAEPVALVLMEAFAAGLPVVASQARAKSILVQDKVTCMCYRPDDRESLIEAVVTTLTDEPIRRRIATTAQLLVRQEFSLNKMGQAYDDALRQFV